MTYPAYSEYKDSGVEWLGDVPDEWNIISFKYIATITTGFAFKSDSFTDEGVALLRIGDILQDGTISLDKVKRLPNKFAIEQHQYIVKNGDILMAMTGATIGKAGRFYYHEQALLNQRVCTFKAQKKLCESFLWYILKANFYQKHIEVTAFGGAQPNISDTELLDSIVAIPSFSEQTVIANFLDRETTKIYTLISKQQKLISLLQEKRQAVISHAVTKGINPDAKMKDSGVEWLGDVPEHWKIASMKYYAGVIDCKHITAPFTDFGVPLASIGEVKGWEVNLRTAKFTTEEYYQLLVEGGRKPTAGDIIYSRNATVGEAALVTESHPKFAMGQDVCLLRLMDDLIPNFLLYQLNSLSIENQLIVAMVGSTFKRINVDDIRNFSISVPPKNEQAVILDFLAYETSVIDTLITKANTAIKLLQERRTALISAAVTGKIDVRTA